MVRNRDKRSDMKFKNLKIGVKLASAFSLLTLLCVALGIFAIFQARGMHDEWERFEQQTLQKRNAAVKGRDALAYGVQNFKNFILRGGDYDKRFAEKMDEIDQAAKELAAVGAHTEEEKDLLRRIEQGTTAYRADMDTLTTMRATTPNPVDLDKAVKGADKPIADALAELQRHTDKDIVKASEGMAQASLHAQTAVGTALAIIVLISVGAAVLITLGITRPLQQAVKVSTALATGDLSARADVQSTDETGQLLQSMNVMALKLNDTIGDIGRVMGAMSRGDLTHSIDRDYEGAFQQIKVNINNTVEKLSQVVAEVNGGAEALAGASEEVSATAQALSQAASEQAASV
ncbi:methyl-accepting chemotaxis protein, partial [Schlegelella sp. S2-27]